MDPSAILLLLNMAFPNRDRESGFICAANEAIEFSLNVFNEFSDKNICHYSKRIRNQDVTTTPPANEHVIVGDRISKFTPIHASVIYQIPQIH